jgi:hypothetical protein
MKTRRKIELGILIALLACIPAVWVMCRVKNEELIDGMAKRGLVERACAKDEVPEYFGQPRCFAGTISGVPAVVALGVFSSPGKPVTRFMPTHNYLMAVIVDDARGIAADNTVELGEKTALVWANGHDLKSVEARLGTVAPLLVGPPP